MTDRDLAHALRTVTEVAESARARRAVAADPSERELSLAVVRHSTALKGALEAWISERAMRVALVK